MEHSLGHLIDIVRHRYLISLRLAGLPGIVNDNLLRRLDPGCLEFVSAGIKTRRNAALEMAFPDLVRPDSPSLRVGAPPVEAEKVTVPAFPATNWCVGGDSKRTSPRVLSAAR